MNRPRNKEQQKQETPPSTSVSAIHSTFLHISSEERPDPCFDDDELQIPMFPDFFHEEDADEQSDDELSHETTSTSPSCYLVPTVLAQSQDYKNDSTFDQSSQVDFSRIDQTFRKRYVNYVTNEKGVMTVTSTYKSDVELLHLLQKTNAPIGMYDEIQKWARKSFAINPKVFVRTNLTRKKALQSIEKNSMHMVAIPFLSLVDFHR
jgi:hypothetical protein